MGAFIRFLGGRYRKAPFRHHGWPPPLYDAFCGPRNEADVKEGSILHELGYTADMVAKF